MALQSDSLSGVFQRFTHGSQPFVQAAFAFDSFISPVGGKTPFGYFVHAFGYESALPPTCPPGPITVMCSDSYPLLLGTDSQSRRRFGLGWYISVTMEYACQHSSFSFSGPSESRITRIANKSYTPSKGHLLLFHLLVDGVNGLGASLDVEVQSRIFQLSSVPER